MKIVLRKLQSRIRALFGKHTLDAEMNEEMRSHIEMQTRENIANGMPHEEARYAALRQFGHVDRIKEACRDQREGFVGRQLSVVTRDVCFALRQLRKSPGFTIAAVLTLALGIGPATVLYSIVDSVILHPIAGVEGERLVTVREFERSSGRFAPGMSAPFIAEMRAATDLFSDVATYDGSTATLDGEAPERLFAARASGNLFRVLGTTPLLGRTFSRSTPGNEDDTEIILSYGLWQRRFNGDPSIVGRTISADSRPRTVIGVMPASFQFPRKGWLCELWLPERISPRDLSDFGLGLHRNRSVLARLAPGVSREQAEAGLEVIASRLVERFPEPGEAWSARMEPASALFSDADLRRNLAILLGVVGFVLLISCANVANLLMARAQSRRREMAVRVALGSSRRQLARLLATESLLLAFLGGALGFVFVVWGASLFRAFQPLELPQLSRFSVDFRVFLIGTSVSALAALVFGSAPIWHTFAVFRSNPVSGALAARGPERRAGLWQRIFAASQIASAMILITGAALMVRTLLNVASTDRGFDSHYVARFGASLSEGPGPEDPAMVRQRAVDLAERIRAMPGIRSVGISQGTVYSMVHADHAENEVRAEEVICMTGQNDPLAVLGMQLLSGRWLKPTDGVGDVKGVVINKAAAEAFWPGESPLHRRLQRRSDYAGFSGQETLVVVGVVKDVRWSPFVEVAFESDPKPILFRPLASGFGGSHFWYHLRSLVPPENLTLAMAREIGVTPGARPTRKVEAVERMFAESERTRNALANLINGFALIGILLSAVGIYGVLAYWVAQRTREFGIRMALGAEAREIMAVVARQGLTTTAMGLGIGTIGALALAQFMKSVLYDIDPHDPLSVFLAAVILAAAAALACLVPALRAVKTHPMEALKCE